MEVTMKHYMGIDLTRFMWMEHSQFYILFEKEYDSSMQEKFNCKIRVSKTRVVNWSIDNVEKSKILFWNGGTRPIYILQDIPLEKQEDGYYYFDAMNFIEKNNYVFEPCSIGEYRHLKAYYFECERNVYVGEEGFTINEKRISNDDSYRFHFYYAPSMLSIDGNDILEIVIGTFSRFFERTDIYNKMISWFSTPENLSEYDFDDIVKSINNIEKIGIRTKCVELSYSLFFIQGLDVTYSDGRYYFYEYCGGDVGYTLYQIICKDNILDIENTLNKLQTEYQLGNKKLKRF